MLKPSQYKHIIWDWNGTLLDDAWLFVDIMNGVLENRNMDTITVKKYRKIFGFPIEEYYKKLGFDIEKESFYESGLEFIRAYEKRRYEADLYPMVNSILSKLVSMNIHHSILSAQHQALLDDLTKYYNIRKYFTEINGLNNYYAHSKIDKGIEIVHNADLPAQSGLGSSSTFTVGLLNSLYALQNYMPTKRELALKAIHVEQDLIGESVGSQDQTAAAFGGLNKITFNGG